MKNLRIFFTVISAVFAAAVIPVGALSGTWIWALGCILCACLFYGLMRLCKQKQEEDDRRARHGDLSELNLDAPPPKSTENGNGSASPYDNSNKKD